MTYYNYNGKILAAEHTIVSPSSRGLRYGEGVFETIRVEGSRVFFLHDHFARLQAGLTAIQLKLPQFFNVVALEDQILKIAKKNKHGMARIRLMCWRRDGGLYDSVSDVCDYSLQSYSLPERYDVNSNGLQLCIFESVKKSVDLLANIKHNNFLIYSLAAKQAQLQHCNDAIVLNQDNNICDTSIANIFWIKNGNVFTNPLTDGPIAGVFRNYLLQILPSIGVTVRQKTCSVQELLEADEIFTSNVIKGCRWVKSIGNKNFAVDRYMEIYRQVLTKLVR